MNTTRRETLLVSIVNYRTPHLVVSCVQSLKDHPPRGTNLEIAVVDNASGDDSLQVIAQAHPDIRLIDAGGNLGFAGGNNLALRGTTADHVMLLNSDALVEDGTLDRLLDVLRANPKVGAVSGRVVNASDGQDQDYPYEFPTLVGMVMRALQGPQYPAQGQTQPRPLARLHGACMVIRGSVLRSVGLLDDAFFMYDEDVDWCTRARDAGWDLWLVPDARVLHHGGASSGREPSGRRARIEASETALRMRYELRRSRYRLYRKHRSAPETFVLKLLTDTMLGISSLRVLWWSWRQPELRPAARALLRTNLRIMRLNPFRLPETVHAR